MKKSSLLKLIGLVTVILLIKPANAITWPVWPDSLNRNIGTLYGQLNCSNTPCIAPILHSGIDIVAPPGTPVYSIKSGYVKAIIYTLVTIGDSAGTEECDAWLYTHMIDSTIAVEYGDFVEAGQHIGDIMTWSQAGFHHLHFGKYRHQGDSISWYDHNTYVLVGGPLNELQIQHDPYPPTFENAYENQIFAFRSNYSDYYFPAGASLYGDVDIICRIHDYIYNFDWALIPHQIEYKIEGDTITPWENSFCFTEPFPEFLDPAVIYQSDGICQSQGDYFDRIFYFNITNTDGDSVLEASDTLNCWRTSYFHNGSYTIYVRASDAYGNYTIESMSVNVENYFNLNGTILLEGFQPNGGTVIKVVSGGQSDTTDITGQFSISGIGGGSQIIEVRHPGHEAIDTVMMMNKNRQLNLTLDFLYVCGDVNGTGTINILDITFLINYLYTNGPAPEFLDAGNVNGDGAVNILDITYLISYLYKDGPEPFCGFLE